MWDMTTSPRARGTGVDAAGPAPCAGGPGEPDEPFPASRARALAIASLPSSALQRTTRPCRRSPAGPSPRLIHLRSLVPTCPDHGGVGMLETT